MPTYPVQEADDYTVRLAAKRRFIERLEREASTRPEPTEAEMQAIMQEIDDERKAIYQKNLTLKKLKQAVERLTKESGRTTYQFGLPDVIIPSDVTDEITDLKQLSMPSTFGLSGFKPTVVPEPTEEEVLEEELPGVITSCDVTDEITDLKQLSTPSTFGLSGFKPTVVPEPTEEEVLEEELTEVKTKIQRTEAEINPIQALPKQEWKGG